MGSPALDQALPEDSIPYSNLTTCGVCGAGQGLKHQIWPERPPLASVPWKIHTSLVGVCRLSDTGQATGSVTSYHSSRHQAPLCMRPVARSKALIFECELV